MLDYPFVFLTIGLQRALILAMTSIWVLPLSALREHTDVHRRIEEGGEQ